MQKLKEDFKLRKSWFSNRSSCIFPLDIKKGSDFAIIFINYWKLKNKINDLIMNLRFFNSKGEFIYLHSQNIINDHYEIRTNKILKKKSFEGMVEVEFLSTKNLRFPFPGISGFYISPKKQISSVHSAGRIKNVSEPCYSENYSDETNFNIKIKKNIKPFFSLFNSNLKKKNNIIKVIIKDNQNKLIKQKKIFNNLEKPFENKIFYLHKIFSQKDIARTSYCVVKTLAYDLFPRMICGNYYTKDHHYEVTHSFPVIKKSDFISEKFLKKRDVKHLSLLPFLKSKNLDLKLRVFPTSNRSNLNANLYVFNKFTKKMENKGTYLIKSGVKNFEYKLKKNEEFGFFSINQKKIPARLNVSRIYSNNNSNFSTDIASGFKSIDAPKKNTHWGSFLCDHSTKVEILIKRIYHYKNKKNSIGNITFYGKNLKKTIKINLKPIDYKILFFDKIHQIKHENLESFSWIANFKNGEGVDIFWNVYNKNFICGDHAF